MLVSIVSAFLLVPSLYVTSPTTAYCAIPILSLPASMELMAVSIFISFNYKVSRVGYWSGLRQGKIVYDLDTAIALYGTLLHSVIYGWLVYWTISIYIAGSIKIALSIRNSPRSINEDSNMTPRLSGHISIFGLIFFELKSLLGIVRQ